MLITAEQCRAARALLGWSQTDLNKAAGVAPQTIVGFERGARTPYERTLRDVRSTFEAAGIVFIDRDEEGGPGVRLAE